MFTRIPKALVIVGSVWRISKYEEGTLDMNINAHELDPKRQPCVPSATRPHVLHFESVENSKKTIAPYDAFHTPQEIRSDKYKAEFPSKFEGRRCVAAVASTCRNAVLFFPATSAPPFYQDANMILHLHCTLLDEALLGVGSRLGAYLWPVVRALESAAHLTLHDDEDEPLVPIDDWALLKGGLPSRPMPCYVVTEWQMMLPPPSAFFSYGFYFTDRSVLDEFDIKSSDAPLPSWKHGFTGRSLRDNSDDLGKVSDLHRNGQQLLTLLTALGTVDEEIASDQSDKAIQTRLFLDKWQSFTHRVIVTSYTHPTLQQLIKQSTLECARTEHRYGAQLVAQGILGPFAHVRVYAFMLANALKSSLKLQREMLSRSGFSAPAMHRREKILTHVTAWIFSSFVPEHPAFGAAVIKRPGLVQEIKRLATMFLARGSEQFKLDPGLFWSDFLENRSLAYVLFPWRNNFVIGHISLELHEILVESLCDFMDLFPEDFFTGLLLDPLSRFRNHVDFEYQRLAMKFYLEKLVDRNKLKERSAGPVGEIIETNAIIEKIKRGVDAEEILPDVESGEGALSGIINDQQPSQQPARGVAANAATSSSSNAQPKSPFARDENYYAMKGAHGNGHMYINVEPTVSPFDRDAGGFLSWLLKQSRQFYQAKDILLNDRWVGPENGGLDLTALVLQSASPAILESGEKRITATTDMASMMFIASRFLRERNNFSQAEWRRMVVDAINSSVEGHSREVHLPSGPIRLSEEQLNVISSLGDKWLTMIVGGGGCGKSLLIAVIVRLFAGEALVEFLDKDSENFGDNLHYILNTHVAVVMAYGTPASNFSRKYRIPVCTIHYASACLNCNFWNDDRQVVKDARSLLGDNSEGAKARILICDEVFVTSLDHMVLILNAFPNAKKFILVGDSNQMRSIDRGNIAELMLEKYSQEQGTVVTLTRNFRLRLDSNGYRLEARTHDVFDAILSGRLITNKKAYGPYNPLADPGTLPGMVAINSWSDPKLIRDALKTCPMINLPHDKLERGAENSLRETCERLLEVIGNKPIHWEQIQFITQRHEEVKGITDYLTHKLFPHIPLHPQYKSLPAYDLFVGERVMFRCKMQAFDSSGHKMTIHKNGIRIIEKIEDVTETVLNSEKKKPNGTTSKETKYVYSNPMPRRSTQEYIRMPTVVSSRRRIITFTDGCYVVCKYTMTAANKDIRFLARGLCATNASMQGLSESVIILYIRPMVSHTFDRNEAYTALTRMETTAIIISTPDMLEKVVQQTPPRRNNQFGEFLLPTVREVKEEPVAQDVEMKDAVPVFVDAVHANTEIKEEAIMDIDSIVVPQSLFDEEAVMAVRPTPPRAAKVKAKAKKKKVVVSSSSSSSESSSDDSNESRGGSESSYQEDESENSESSDSGSDASNQSSSGGDSSSGSDSDEDESDEIEDSSNNDNESEDSDDDDDDDDSDEEEEESDSDSDS